MDAKELCIISWDHVKDERAADSISKVTVAEEPAPQASSASIVIPISLDPEIMIRDAYFGDLDRLSWQTATGAGSMPSRRVAGRPPKLIPDLNFFSRDFGKYADRWHGHCTKQEESICNRLSNENKESCSSIVNYAADDRAVSVNDLSRKPAAEASTESVQNLNQMEIEMPLTSTTAEVSSTSNVIPSSDTEMFHSCFGDLDTLTRQTAAAVCNTTTRPQVLGCSLMKYFLF